MPLQDKRFQFLNGLAHGVGLTQDVNTVLILLYHLAYPCHMPFDVRESFQYIRFPFFLHLTSSFHVTRCLLFLVQNVRRKRSELLTTVTDESAIEAAAKIGAFYRRKGMSGERITVGIRMTL